MYLEIVSSYVTNCIDRLSLTLKITHLTVHKTTQQCKSYRRGRQPDNHSFIGFRKTLCVGLKLYGTSVTASWIEVLFLFDPTVHADIIHIDLVNHHTSSPGILIFCYLLHNLCWLVMVYDLIQQSVFTTCASDAKWPYLHGSRKLLIFLNCFSG